MEHVGTRTLRTPRLVLRRHTADDAQAMYRVWCSDAQVARFLRWPPHRSVAETCRLLEEWMPRYADPAFYQWAITRADGTLIGGISAAPSEQQPALYEPGYCLGRAFWGQGYATEALKAVVRELFCTVGLERLLCSHALENPASGRVMCRAGFVPTGTGVYHKFDGTPIACQCYEQTKEQYDARTR